MNYELHKNRLAAGATTSFRPKGNSMRPRIESGSLITVSPDVGEPQKGDVLFCKVRGNFYVHLVLAVRGDQVQIGNNRGHVNGWIGRNSVFGKVVKIEP
jgi:phage repressor protein C with HTH and peptisase S24 domain